MSGPPLPEGAGVRLPAQDVVAVAVKSRLADLARFPVLDGAGRVVGEVTWDGAARLAHGPARRGRARIDAELPHTLVVRDADGVVLVLTRPRLGLDRVLLRVARADGSEVGTVVGAWWTGGRTCRLVAGGRRVGTVRRVRGPGRAPDGYTVTDASGVEVARIRHEPGPPAPRYVTHLPGRPPEPLASLVLAAALTVDTALTAYTRLG